MGSPENRERPNASELRPKQQLSDDARRKLGQAAINAAQKKK